MTNMLRVWRSWVCLMALCCAFPAEAAALGSEPVVLLSTYVVSPARLAKLAQAAQQAGLTLRVVSAENDNPQTLQQHLAGAQLLVIDAPHSSVMQALAAKYGDSLHASAVPYVVVGDYAAVSKHEVFESAPLQSHRGVSAAWAQRLREYWRFGGAANTQLALQALSAVASRDGTAALPAAHVLPEAGFYHPHWQQLEAQWPASFDTDAQTHTQTVAIAVNRAVFTSDDTGWLDSLIVALQKRGLRAYAFYGPRQQKDMFYQMTHSPQGRRRADVLINAALVFNPTERKAELERIGIPVLQTMPALAMDAAQWEQSREGLAQSDVAYYYTPSEFAGMIDAVLITARDARSGALQPLPSQIDAVADKAAALTRLRQTPAAQRKVALMVYNYPAGESNFGASFLNVPKSLHNILHAMARAGYRTAVPSAQEITSQVQSTLGAFYKPEMLQGLVQQSLADTLPLSEYLAWFRALPPATQSRIEAYWGRPESAALLLKAGEAGDEAAFLIPRVDLGNVVVLPQPLRYELGAYSEPTQRSRKISHRALVPLSHHYLATYLWLRSRFSAHALVHVGTHGTLEWAPGKERGLSAQDDPLLALGDLPNIYPYIMDNLGEALTAKRRGRAVMVSHSTPMFSPAGFRPKAHEMHDLMHDWETVDSGPTKVKVENRLIEYFVEQQYHRDLGWPADKIRSNFAGFMEVLHPYLDELAQTAQPLGLATFGEVPSPERRLLNILQTLRKPLIDALGEDIDEVFLLDSAKIVLSRPVRWLQVALRDPEAASLLDLRKVDTQAAQHLVGAAVPNRAEDKALKPEVLLALARRAQQLDAALADNQEIQGLLTALDARHLAASYGGDPVRNPESLPTGRNLYGFDPSRVPTRQAWELGVAAFKAWMSQHRADNNGRWPEKIAFSLWAGETMRHQGVMESQALFALGMRPLWDEAGRVIALETISAQELNRPRLDVLLSVTGSYRDQFSSVMRWLDTAVRRVSALPAQDNFAARNSQALARSFQAKGASTDQASDWSTQRVFSNESGAYGTGLSEGTLATETWKQANKGGGDAQLSEAYLARMGYAVLPQGPGGQPQTGAATTQAPTSAYAANLMQVDAALLSRTSNTYGMMTSDDPFQYLGGIALAVRQLTGRDPALYVQNLRDETEVRTDSAARSLAIEMQTRYLHPQWIKSQQAEGYSGTLQVLKTANFLWGWQVTAPQTVRQDHWQSLHNVYVRDQYQLGTRKWLEGDNRAAFAQTLERMLDAVRLNYWQPDAATRQELVQAYTDALQATGLRSGNPAVERFAQSLLADGSRPTAASVPVSQPPNAQAQPQAGAAPAVPYVRGLQMLAQAIQPPPAPAQAVLSTLASLLTVSVLFAAGALRQTVRGRRALMGV